MKTTIRRAVVPLLFAGLLALASSNAEADSIASAVWSGKCADSTSEQPCGLKIYFDKDLTDKDKGPAGNEANYALFKFGAPPVTVSVTAAEVLAPEVTNDPDNRVLLTLEPGFTPEENVDYMVVAKDLTFGGKKIQEPIVKTVVTDDGSDGGEVSSGYTIVSSDSREESSVYFAGEITGASGQGPFYSVDAKVEAPRDYSRWNRLHRLSPFFNLRAGSSPGADPDSMDFGYSWRFNLIRFYDSDDFALSHEGSAVPNLWWTNAGKIEANRDFDAANVFWESKVELPITPVNRRGRLFRLNPFAGAELGRSLKSPSRAFEGSSLARLLAGSTLLVKLGNPTRFSLEASYIRRWPLKDELTLIENDQKMLVIQSFGQGPREYVDVKMKFPINDFFGAYAGYEYGELPPTYGLVDHRFRLGIVYQFALQPPK